MAAEKGMQEYRKKRTMNGLAMYHPLEIFATFLVFWSSWCVVLSLLVALLLVLSFAVEESGSWFENLEITISIVVGGGGGQVAFEAGNVPESRRILRIFRLKGPVFKDNSTQIGIRHAFASQS